MNCRHCRAALRLPFLDLGSAPPSNAYLSEASLRAPEAWYPLRLLVCESCWLVQTEDHAGREALFTDDYAYFSSFSTSWLQHSQAYAAAMASRFALGAGSLVAEVAANDGYLLQYVQQAGIACYGVEPTASTAAAARAKGIHIVERFFGVTLAQELASQGRQVDLVAANNVLAHVPDINDFVAGFAALLKPQGVATFEFPHLLRMVAENQFDTAYHEHYSYLSLTAVQRIFAANGLAVFDVEQLPTHGGSLRVFAQRTGAGHPTTPAVAAVLQQEHDAGVAGPAFYSGFQACADAVKDGFVGFLLEARRSGKKVAAYGAAKGNTLMNYAGVRPDWVSFVVDRNPAKQGRYMPGSRIPIVCEQRLFDERPDYVLLLPWNLQSELVRQLEAVRGWGGRFVTAVPRLELLLNGRIAYTKPSITETEVGYATDAAREGWGEHCYDYLNRFEADFARYLGVKHAIATSSCTGALHLGLAALGIGAGDEVILADSNWIASVAPAVHLGATPVFVDILADSWCLDPDRVEAAITPRTKAILAVHLYGNLCDMDRLLALGRQRGIPVIEDAAEAIGSRWGDRRAGSRGRFGSFSFHGTKTLTTGEGGMFVTDDDALYEQVLTLSNHGRARGQKKQFWPDVVGFKYKMSNLQAALGCGQLERIEALESRKRAILQRYRELLADCPGVSMNPEPPGTTNGAWMPTVVFAPETGVTREKLQAAFAAANIDARVFFHPLSSLPMFAGSAGGARAADIAGRAINLPSFHDIREDELQRVAEVVRGALRG